MACGLSIYEENFELFYSSLLESSKLTQEDLVPKKYIDSQLYIDKITFEIVELINKLEPYGAGNPKPVFGDRNIEVLDMKILGKNENTLKLQLKARGRKLDGIMFSNKEKIKVIYDYVSSKANNKNPFIDIIYYPDINEFMGNKNLQVRILDLR